nr:MAG TPA: hypothetical protein [Caudoviricetes sp.]
MAYEKTVWANGQAPALDAEHLNKIEQGIADAVSVTPQTLNDGQKTQARENINALGEDYAHIADCNLCTKSGIYRCDQNTENAPSYLTPGLGHILIVAAWDKNTLVQMYFAPSIGCEFIRYAVAAANGISWQPWECVNPLMQLGVEYRTPERYLGKPVYVKAFNVSSLPNNGNISVNIATNSDGSADETIRAITAYGVTSNGSSIPAWAWARDTSKKIYLQLYLWIVYLETTFDASNESATIVVKYTKTTN